MNVAHLRCVEQSLYRPPARDQQVIPRRAPGPGVLQQPQSRHCPGIKQDVDHPALAWAQVLCAMLGPDIALASDRSMTADAATRAARTWSANHTTQGVTSSAPNCACCSCPYYSTRWASSCCEMRSSRLGSPASRARIGSTMARPARPLPSSKG